MNQDKMDVEAVIEKIVDRSSWVNFKFSDLVENIVEKVVPKECGLEHYIGLKHLDTGSLKIRRYGESAEIEGDKLKIYKGDLIFAKRNAYLKRVAIADFDAVASAHSLVLRPKSENVLPEFLPFFLLSEKFWERAIEISVGSLSPTINWKVLAKQEFLLPPKDQQAQLAALLWAMDEVIERERGVSRSLEISKRANLKEVFSKENCERMRICSISENLDNRRIPIKQSDRINGEYPYYGASGIVDYINGYIYDEPILLISEDGENLKSRRLPIAYEVDHKCWVNNHAHVLRIVNYSRLIVSEYFNWSDVSDFITGGTRPKITKGMLMDIPIYLPKREFVSEFEDLLESFNKGISGCFEKISSSQSLQKSLINQIF